MPLQATSGAASYDAFGGGAAAAPPTYIEDVFSTWLYTGNGSTQTITNGIDLSTKGGLVWFKNRNSTNNHALYDTARGATNRLSTSQTSGTGAQVTDPTSLTAFNSNGFSIGSDNSQNENTFTFASWTFREQPKFFDVVTYTGTGVARTVAHNLGSVPGCIIVKRTDTAGFDWIVYHRSTGNTNRLLLNDTAPAASGTSFWNDTTPTSTVFTVGTNVNGNASGGTYVAYLFAHDAGGFGLTGTDNVISCGSFTTDGSGNATVSLGYEPQWLLTKSTNLVDQWYMLDSMRGWPVTTASTKILAPNTSDAETTGTFGNPTATGFTIANGGATKTYIYIAIRRGPMKVPTTGTSVFSPNTIATAPATFNIGFPLDLIVNQPRNGAQALWGTRLQGPKQYLDSSSTAAEVTAGTAPWAFDKQNDSYANYAGTSVAWNFRRAPSFMDVVVSAGTGSTNQARTHNLGAVPELIIVKDRSSGAANWVVYSATLGQNFYLNLNNTNNQQASTGAWGTSAFTASTFYCLDTGTWCASIGNSGVFYLFATCPGVSKVGSYTGNGTTQTIDCGFGASGARFVLIKRTDSTGDWYVYDTARGMTVLTDPYLRLNSTAAETATLGSVTTVSTGFAVNAAILAAINTNAASYIFLAIS